MQMHNPNHYEISFFLGFGDRSEIAYDTPKRCGTQIPVTVINSAKFMQSLCKVYAKFMQGRNILSPKNIKGGQRTLFFLGLLGGGGRGRRAQLTLFPRNACASTSALCQA